jgi:dihydrodipicolinate synthase/N-acetylneuraminate lyase
MEVWQLLEAGQYEEAQARLDHVNEAIGPVRAKIGAVSGGYRFGKGLAAAVGRPAGPPRPPTLPTDEGEIAELRAVVKGLGWLD